MEAEAGVVDDELPELEPPDVPTSPVLAQLRELRTKHEATHEYDLEVPGFDGLLVLRCGPIGGRYMQTMRERLETSKSPDKDFNLNADTLITACREVLARQRRTDPLEPIDPDGGTTRIDDRLAELLQIRADTARDVLRRLFAAVPDPDLAIGVAAGEYMTWASSANGQVQEELLGES